MCFGFTKSMRQVAVPNSHLIANILMLLELSWYLRQQAHWFRTKLHVGPLRSWAMAILMFFITSVLLVVTAAVLFAPYLT